MIFDSRFFPGSTAKYIGDCVYIYERRIRTRNGKGTERNIERGSFCPALVSSYSSFFPLPPSLSFYSLVPTMSLVSGSQLRREIYCKHREPIHWIWHLFYLCCCTCTFTAKRWFAPSTDQASSSSARDGYNDIGIGATNERMRIARARNLLRIFSEKCDHWFLGF